MTVIYFCPVAGEMEQRPGGGFDVCCNKPFLHEPVLPAAYAAIRRDMAEEIAQKCLRRSQLAERVPEGERSGVREGMVLTWLAAEKLARESGGQP